MKGFSGECGGGTAGRRRGRSPYHLEPTAAELGEPDVCFRLLCNCIGVENLRRGAFQKNGVPGAVAVTLGAKPTPFYWLLLNARGRGAVA